MDSNSQGSDIHQQKQQKETLKGETKATKHVPVCSSANRNISVPVQTVSQADKNQTQTGFHLLKRCLILHIVPPVYI